MDLFSAPVLHNCSAYEISVRFFQHTNIPGLLLHFRRLVFFEHTNKSFFEPHDIHFLNFTPYELGNPVDT